jgi:hypothetical protein
VPTGQGLNRPTVLVYSKPSPWPNILFMFVTDLFSTPLCGHLHLSSRSLRTILFLSVTAFSSSRCHLLLQQQQLADDPGQYVKQHRNLPRTIIQASLCRVSSLTTYFPITSFLSGVLPSFPASFYKFVPLRNKYILAMPYLMAG